MGDNFYKFLITFFLKYGLLLKEKKLFLEEQIPFL